MIHHWIISIYLKVVPYRMTKRWTIAVKVLVTIIQNRYLFQTPRNSTSIWKRCFLKHWASSSTHWRRTIPTVSITFRRWIRNILWLYVVSRILIKIGIDLWLSVVKLRVSSTPCPTFCIEPIQKSSRSGRILITYCFSTNIHCTFKSFTYFYPFHCHHVVF